MFALMSAKAFSLSSSESHCLILLTRDSIVDSRYRLWRVCPPLMLSPMESNKSEVYTAMTEDRTRERKEQSMAFSLIPNIKLISTYIPHNCFCNSPIFLDTKVSQVVKSDFAATYAFLKQLLHSRTPNANDTFVARLSSQFYKILDERYFRTRDYRYVPHRDTFW